MKLTLDNIEIQYPYDEQETALGFDRIYSYYKDGKSILVIYSDYYRMQDMQLLVSDIKKSRVKYLRKDGQYVYVKSNLTDIIDNAIGWLADHDMYILVGILDSINDFIKCHQI